MDYEKAYKAVLQTAAQWIKDGCTDKEKICLECVFPELRESEDERIRKDLIYDIERLPMQGVLTHRPTSEYIAYLEKQKDASKAIEAVDRIDKYIDEHLANAHDMKDSNPDKKYYRGWDDALGKMAGILQDVYSDEKQKEQKPTDRFEEAREKYQVEWSEEEAAAKYAEPYISTVADNVKWDFKAGAEWQASQMPMPEDTVLFQKGVAEGRRLEREDMLKDAVEVEGVVIDNGSGGTIIDTQCGVLYLPPLVYAVGEKVRIVVLKEEEE